MKKWIGALCSGLAGVLSLIFLAIPAFTIDSGIADSKYSGWKLLTTGDFKDFKLASLTWYRIFVWIIVVLAIILIVACVLQVLDNLNIIKLFEVVNTTARYALIAIAIVSILALIANFGIRAELIDDFGKAIKKMISVGASLWVVIIINTISAVCANVFTNNK